MLIYCFLHVHLFLVLINLWFIKKKFNMFNKLAEKLKFVPCFHFLLPMCEICRFSPVLILRLCTSTKAHIRLEMTVYGFTSGNPSIYVSLSVWVGGRGRRGKAEMGQNFHV